MTMVERVARAIAEADLGYSIQLVRLVDGVSTYRLTDSDRGDALEFGSHADALEYITAKKLRVAAHAAIESMKEPTERMLDAHWEQTGESILMRSRVHVRAQRMFSAMIQAALEEGE